MVTLISIEMNANVLLVIVDTRRQSLRYLANNAQINKEVRALVGPRVG
jgi:hypothetical protein